MIRRLISCVLAAAALLCATPAAFAQSTYPTTAGGRVAGVVVLQCDTSGLNCTSSGSSGVNQKVTVCDFTNSCGQNGVPADGSTNGVTTLFAMPFNMIFNGTTWDRARGDANGQSVQPALSNTFWSSAPAVGGIVNTTTAVTVKAAAGAGVRNYIYSMQCNSDALGAATEIAIRDGAAGTVMYRQKIATSGWLTPVDLNFDPPIRGTANTLVEIVTLTASVTGGVYCNLQGYTGI